MILLIPPLDSGPAQDEGLSRSRKNSPSPKKKKGGAKEKEENSGDVDMTQCTGGFACDCTICMTQIRKERRAAATAMLSSEHIEINEMLYEGVPRDFFWLMTNLLPASEKVKGCELIFPDTAFFKKGKPVIVIKSDPRDFCLLGIRNQKKLSLQSIYKDFQNVVRRRKKDFYGPFGRLYLTTLAMAKPS